MARNTRSAAAAGELRPVPELETDVDVDLVSELADEIERRTIAVRLDPETNLIGALMAMPAGEVAEVLEVLGDDDIERPLARTILIVIRKLVAGGRAPDPVAVVSTIRNPDHRGAGGETTVVTEVPNRFETIAKFVADCYTTGIGVDVWGTTYQVVDDAYRRAFGMAGLRLTQMADYPADTEDIEQVAAAAVLEWRGYWHRLRAIKARYAHTPVPAPEDVDAEADDHGEHRDEPAPEDDH
ncbi:hypothetical protein [Nocardia asteroides]